MTHHFKKKLRLTPEILLRIYKNMKENPDKNFMLSDFKLASQQGRIYFNTLIKLNLIELNKDYQGIKRYKLKQSLVKNGKQD